MFDIKGKVAIVTGAAGGLGGAIFEGLSKAGAKVVGADLREPSSLSSGTSFEKVDVSRREAVCRLLEQTCNQFGRLDIMVANAAIGGGARAEEET